MESALERQLVSAATQLEQHVDDELERLQRLDADDIQLIRRRRLEQMKQQQEKQRRWLDNGHGEYSEICEEKQFFDVPKKSENVVCHFYREDFFRCKVVDKHLTTLAVKHPETKFVKINAEKCPFLTERLRIKVLPSLALIKDGKTKDYVVGFQDLGNKDDFSTEMLEWRIAQAGVVDYSGDLLVPPKGNKTGGGALSAALGANSRAGARLGKKSHKKIRSGQDSDSENDGDDY